MANPRNESLREPLRNDCLGPSGLGIEAWKRAKSGKSLFSTLHPRDTSIARPPSM